MACMFVVSSVWHRVYNSYKEMETMDKVVTPDLEKSFSKNPKPINEMLASAVRRGVIKEFHTPSGRTVPVSIRQEIPQN